MLSTLQGRGSRFPNQTRQCCFVASWLPCRPTPWLTGAGSRRLEGTNISHENAEGMAYVGVRVEPTVRLGREVEGEERAETCHVTDTFDSVATES